MARAQKNRAFKQEYISQSQLILDGFETPFSQRLNPYNRWVILAHKIPWDILVSVYQSQMLNSKTGAEGINPHVAIGSIIIKRMCDLSDWETVLQIQENMYMQYFIGYCSFSNEEPFDPSLFVEFRKRIGMEQINSINEKILGLRQEEDPSEADESNPASTAIEKEQGLENDELTVPELPSHEGKLILDATACQQDISYPNDLNLLNDARDKSEELIDQLYDPQKHEKKPRTYREKARKQYLQTAKKKIKSKKEIYRAIKKQLSYVKRNINIIHSLFDTYKNIPLGRH